ncbi:hypothetical protein DC498_02400 [Terrimonas sp.]|uniref:hypothetical protein n=1 Tax=Terrimonas sp. TaxID=1914338 RepID=UPI000D51300E|nr:hypothetical protein [Terrimonas sp.]PVD54251.1 hypothetical protein DC498_02400 [Terrimonas sp.]
MKPKIIHQEAMDYSFKARQALEQGFYANAFDLYSKAAELESQVAEFYFDKPDLEPTRSVIIRSAAFLNIKAGMVENAKRFIFFGLLNSKDEQILSQLNNALELAVSLGQMTNDAASREFNYLNLLRQRSIHYVIEPATPVFGHSVSLESIRDFTADYLKSLKAFATSKLRQVFKLGEEIEDSFKNEIDKLINPLVTSSSYGSFKFSIANDFLSREGESQELLELKANVVAKYHNEIFVNPLNDDDIQKIKNYYSPDEVNEIFKPLTRIKSNSSPYKVGYYDSEDFNKKFVSKIVNKQRQKLLTFKPITQEDIGELENSITHRRSSQDGKVHKTTIFKQQMKSAEWNFKTNQIEPADHSPIILNEDIVVDVNFNSNTGFTVSYSDFRIENTNIEYTKALKGFYNEFYFKLKHLSKTDFKNDEEQKDWEAGKKLIGNPDLL